MPHQLVAAGLQARDIYPELKKVLLQRALKRDMERVFTQKIWVMGRYAGFDNFSEFYCENLC